MNVTVGVRAFVGALLGEEVTRRVADVSGKLADAVRPRGWQVSWVPPHKVHVTVQFLGNVEEARLAGAGDAVAAACAEHAPFDVVVRGLGAFPARGTPSVLWIGVEDGGGPLASLAGDVAERLLPLGFERDHRTFHAHATLGRVRKAGSGGLGEMAREVGETDCGRTSLSELTLFRSDLATGTYHVLGRFSLGGGAPEGPSA